MNKIEDGKKLSPYQRIMRASRRGIGLNLNSEEVFSLSMDVAIVDAAFNDDERQEYATAPPPTPNPPRFMRKELTANLTTSK